MRDEGWSRALRRRCSHWETLDGTRGRDLKCSLVVSVHEECAVGAVRS